MMLKNFTEPVHGYNAKDVPQPEERDHETIPLNMCNMLFLLAGRNA